MDIDRDLQDNYLKWTQNSLEEMRTHQANLTRDPSNKDLVDAIYAIAHNIKGMGSSFGFSLMTDTGTSFCRYIRKLDGRTINLDVVDAHIRSFEVVLVNRIQGDGGDMGRDLIDHLTQMVDQNLAA